MRLFNIGALAAVALSSFATLPVVAQQQPVARPAVRLEIVDEGRPAYTGNALPLTLHTVAIGDTSALANIPATWESSDPSRAWVSSAGTVVFLREGTVTITARRGLATASKSYGVQGNPAVKVALAAPARARIDETVHVAATAFDEQGRPIVGDRLNYGVTPARATIDDHGDFVAREPGTYTVLAEVNGKADSRTIVVDGAAPALQGAPAPGHLAVREPRFTAYVGTSIPLSADLGDQGTTDARQDASLQWSVDGGANASISPDGVLTALAPGRVTVTARAGQSTAQRTIRIYPNPTARLTISAFEHHLTPGETLHVSVDPLAPGARTLHDARVVYGVSEPGSRDGVHASITDDGRFVATRPGVYTIFAAVGDKADQQTLLVER